MGSALPITKGPFRFLLIALVVLAGGSSAIAKQVVHLRGIVLGTTPNALDVGVPSGDDVHLDMDRKPAVSIAEPDTWKALRVGDRVGVVSSNGRTRAIACGVVVLDGEPLLRDGRYAWDAPRGAIMTSGRIVAIDRSHARLSIVVGYAHTKRRIDVPDGAPIVSVRPGSRNAFLNPHAVFVFATPPDGGLSLVLQRAIVGDGDLKLPL